MRRVLVLGVLLSLFAWAAIADAPETGVLTGTVSDPSGTPLPGVLVTISGERGEQSQVTEAGGNFRFGPLVPGSYSVKAFLEGFAETTSTAQVTAGGQIRADLTLRLVTEETITVTSEAPMIDKYNVTAGANVSSELGEQAAGINRTYYGVINMLPGVSSDAENQAIQGTRPSVNGAHFADSGVFVDGVDTTFARFGGSRLILPTTATTEVTMESGGSGAEYGRFVGSATNVIVKSGTNKFHGAALGSYQEVRWGEDYKSHVELEGNDTPGGTREFSPAPRDFFKREPQEWDGNSKGYEASLGGPIKRDKVWFFVGANSIDTTDFGKVLNGDIIDTSWNSKSRIAKFNLQPGQKHQISASYIDAPQFRNYFHSPSGDKWSPTPHDLPTDLGTLSWNYSISSETFLEAKLSTMKSDENKFLAPQKQNVGRNNPISEVVAPALAEKQMDPRFPPTSQPCPFYDLAGPGPCSHWPGNNYDVYVDSLDDDSWHNGWLLDNGFGTNSYPRDQANAAVTQFLGQNHELKIGFDYQDVKWKSNVRKTNLYSADAFNQLSFSGYDNCSILTGPFCYYADYNPPDLLAQGNFSESDNQNTAFFVRDRFTVGDHWTFNVGLRAEMQQNKNDIGRKVVDATVVAPRFAGSYDIKGDGSKLITLSLGRTHAQLNQQLTNQWLMETWTGYYGQDNYLFCNAVDAFILNLINLPLCNLGGKLPQNEPGYTYLWNVRRPGKMFQLVDEGVIDYDLRPYYKDEVILGFEWQFTKNWALDTKAIYWELGDMIGATMQQSPDGDVFEFVANYKDYPDRLRKIGVASEDQISQWEDGVKEYQALQIQINRRFANGWALYNNITLSDSDTTGSGAWWNNWVSTYGYMMNRSLNQTDIDNCAQKQLGFDTGGNKISDGRIIPIDCEAAFHDHLGDVVSLINRRGKDGVGSTRYDEGGAGADRPIILKSFGYKQWTVGKQTFTLGGSAVWQDGVGWGRVEEIDLAFLADGAGEGLDVGTNGLDMVAEKSGTRRINSHWWVNLTGSWGFPVKNQLTGELRVEVMNATDNQAQLAVLDKGQVRRVRREFQQPRQIRALVSFHF